MAKPGKIFQAALLAFGAALAGAAATLFAKDDGPKPITPRTGPMAVSGSFGFVEDPKEPGKTRRSVSGIAFTGGDLAFLAFDEGLEGRFATLSETAYVADPTPIRLRDDGKEVDAEGAAADRDHLYVVGSHARKRKGKPNPAARLLARFDLGSDGRIKRDAGGAIPLPKAMDLTATLRAFPELDRALGEKIADGKGLNIEGLALSGGRLVIGFRGPTDGKDAFLLALDAEAFFTAAPANATLERVTVGEGRGVRDLAAVDGGLLVLAGPDDDESNARKDWRIVFWDGATATPLARLALPKVDLDTDFAGCRNAEIKPEAMAVTAERPDGYRVVILSDGLCDGGPMWFDVPKAK